MVKCAASAFGNAPFDLTLQTNSILNGQSNTINTVTYYTSLNNANNAVSPTNYIFTTGQTIYVRVQNATDPGCFTTTSFNLIVNPLPVVDDLEDVIVCGTYTLQPLTNGNYFTATNGGGTMLHAGDVITETTTIHIYNQPAGPGTCGNNSSFTVTIVDTSEMTPEDVTRCGSYTLPALTYGSYYTAPGATGTQIPAGTVISASQTVYYYFATQTAPICIVDSSFMITIIPTVEVGERPNVFECSSYTLPALSIGNYYTGPGGTGNQLAAGTQIIASQTIYVYATTTGTTPCSDEDSFEVVIGITQPQNISQCNGYTLPELTVGNYFTGPQGTGTLIPGGTVINSSTTVYIYAPTASGGPNCTDNLFFTLSIAQPQIDTLSDVSVCESYTLPSLTNGEYFTGTAGTGIQLYPGDVILTTQTIYIFKRLDSTCFNESSFTVTINPPPASRSRSDMDI